MSIDNQFYPTPYNLACHMWNKFKIKPSNYGGNFILDPQAGRGDLIAAIGNHLNYHVDAVEIDFNNQAILRDKKINVVGHDFLQFEGKKHYTHIIMNPPFKNGGVHVLHAWEILKSGELVALINAETLKNKNNKHGQLLLKIIKDNGGSVEYIDAAFTTEDTQRKANVNCALIHLEKKSNSNDLDFLDSLKPDLTQGKTEEFNTDKKQELAIKQDTIKQAVIIFDAAVKAMRNEVRIKNKLVAESAYYYGLLSDSILKEDDDDETKPASRKNPRKNPRKDPRKKPTNNNDSQEEYNKRYNELKEKAWSHILTATEIGQNLSSDVRKTIEKQFSDVVLLEFTAANIYGFLLGLINGREDMNNEAVLNVFDAVTRHHTGNREWYKGWKSNDKHKTNAYKIKMTRFIIPTRIDFYSPADELNKFKDIDIVFALLSGKKRSDFLGIYDIFSNKETFNKLRSGERIKTEFFDIRFYASAGTIHYFPTSKKYIEKLNNTVGRLRQWLPPANERVSDNFWLQYNKAEEITRAMSKAGKAHNESAHIVNDGRNAQEIEKLIHDAGEKLNISMNNLLDKPKEPQEEKTPAAAKTNVLEIAPKLAAKKSTPTTQKTTPVSRIDIEKIKAQYKLNL